MADSKQQPRFPPQGGGHGQKMKALFIQQIKWKYKQLYESVQLVPFLHKKLYCVDKVFIGGGIDLLSFGADGTSSVWTRLTSYHEILQDSPQTSSQRVVEGQAGMGKSTLTLQLVYDWCNKTQGSYLLDIEIVILLPLRQLKGVSSIERAIKILLLPCDSKIKEKDIVDILNNCKSVVVILDGFDEYPDQDRDSKVLSELLQTIFQKFDVVITTRYMPREFAMRSRQFRLRGFDKASRNEYISKVIAPEDEESAEKIRAILKKNLFLSELCAVPLFFAMFVHLAHESAEFPAIKTVTEFFLIVMKGFHTHFESKIKDVNIPHSSLDKDHHKLSELAFEGLVRKDKQTSWTKEKMIRRIGRTFYQKYIDMGILVEEDIYRSDLAHDKFSVSPIKITQVKFYHALFNEWYAAHHLSELAARPDVRLDQRDGTYETHINLKEKDMLRYLDPIENEYVFRFASGLHSDAADKLDRYMTTKYGGEQFAMLCVLEQSEKTEKVLKEINKMGTTPVMFHSDQSRLHHQSLVKILQIAENEEYPIFSVWIYSCFGSVDLDAKVIVLRSGIAFPVLQTLVCLEFRERNKTFSETDITDIMAFASLFPNVETLKFVYCLMPRSIPSEAIQVLLARNVQVLWDNDFAPPFQMNLSTGEWQNNNEPLTDSDYQDEVELFERLSRHSTQPSHTINVPNMKLYTVEDH